MKSINSLVFVMKTDCFLCEAGLYFYVHCRRMPGFEGLVMLSRT